MQSLAGIRVVPYVGTPFAQPVQIGGIAARVAPIGINFLTYGANSANPNLGVSVSLFGGNVKLLSSVKSVYIDNDNSNVPIYVTAMDTGFTVSAAPQTSGWYLIATNNYQFQVTGIGFSDNNQPQVAIFFCDQFIPPSVDPGLNLAIQFGLASPIVAVPGSGGSAEALTIISGGNCLSSTRLTVSGGGGTGMQLQVSAYTDYQAVGAVEIINPGQGYTGQPVITATDPFSPPPVWRVNQYNQGEYVTFDNQTWLCASNETSPSYNPEQMNSYKPGSWQSTGLINQEPIIQVTLSTISGGIVVSTQSNYAAKALGDQVSTFAKTVTGLGVFQNNLFGSPFGSGFIYLTKMQIVLLNTLASPIGIQLQDSFGDTAIQFEGITAGILLDLDNINYKFPATEIWQLNCTQFNANATLNFAFGWTYNNI